MGKIGKILMALSLLSLTACANWEVRPKGVAALQTPADVQRYLERNVDKKTLKKWDKAISDDVVLIETECTSDGRKCVGTGR